MSPTLIIFCLPIYRSIGQGRNKDFRNVLLSSCDKECKLLNKVVNLVLLLVLLVVILNNFWQDLLVVEQKSCYLQCLLLSILLLDKSSYTQGKGSRFQHAEKLQFTEVIVTLSSHVVV